MKLGGNDFIIIYYSLTFQGQFLLYIQVREIDTGIFAANTHVNDFFISMQLPLDSSFTPPQSINGDFNDGSIELGFRVQCDAGFIGDDCTSMLESNKRFTFLKEKNVHSCGFLATFWALAQDAAHYERSLVG